MNRSIKAIIYNLCFFGVNTIFFLVITSLAIKVMGKEFYGLWMILNAILLFSSVGTLNIGLVVNKFASEAGRLPALRTVWLDGPEAVSDLTARLGMSEAELRLWNGLEGERAEGGRYLVVRGE